MPTYWKVLFDLTKSDGKIRLKHTIFRDAVFDRWATTKIAIHDIQSYTEFVKTCAVSLRWRRGNQRQQKQQGQSDSFESIHNWKV